MAKEQTDGVNEFVRVISRGTISLDQVARRRPPSEGFVARQETVACSDEELEHKTTVLRTIGERVQA